MIANAVISETNKVIEIIFDYLTYISAFRLLEHIVFY